ncbi:MAG TPA: pyridoxine 5'-phosphate synthase [Chitinophagales bacterium]|nr:pyridoxine 5'-phosphate synthase [Chitinophagales bacterium]
MTRLSVNINKIATLRNARGGNIPDLLQMAKDCERFGAQGITVHPRPDERHIRVKDVYELKPLVKTEFNIEGYPNGEYLNLALEVKPHQATLVPDKPDQLTSDAGWDTLAQHDFLSDVVKRLKEAGIRVSLFVYPLERDIEGAKRVGADRVELYTGPYARQFFHDKVEAVRPYVEAAEAAHKLKLGVNAGHDLNLDNLQFFKQSIKHLDEVSIGHALISDALYFGLEKTIEMYLERLQHTAG